jgi:hypothetical protein
MPENLDCASSHGPSHRSRLNGSNPNAPMREIPSPLQGMRWQVDPTIWALDESRWKLPAELPHAFCVEVGRRLLLAQLEYSEWVLRRVEKVHFERDRSVTRDISIDLSVHHEAPVFIDADGNEQYLVPLSIMRRRTLVNLDLSDEDSKSLTMPGIRLTQQLDQSILLAAAATDSVLRTLHWPGVMGFVRTVVAGTYREVIEALANFDRFTETSGDLFLVPLRENSLFCATLDRFRKNFTLYVFTDKRLGRQRLLRMKFDEPMEWSFQKPALESNDDGSRWTYESRHENPWHERTRILAALGLQPTRIRFQTPSAENAASYHFEFTAPPGVRIVRATLLAGRPNNPVRHVSTDHIVGHSPTIALHAVEIPNGSLCRAQVDLRIPARGWLTTVVATSLAIAVMLTSVAVEYWSRLSWGPEEITNVVLVLVTGSAASVALVAQQEFKGVAARMVTPVRTIGVIVTVLPIIVAILLVYSRLERLPLIFPSERWILLSIALFSGVLACINLAAWVGSLWDDHRRVTEESPWDMTNDKPREPPTNFSVELEGYGFDSPAIGVRSSEGWHEIYDWLDTRQRDAVTAISPTAFWRLVSQSSEFIENGPGKAGNFGWPGCAAHVAEDAGGRPPGSSK